MALIPHKADPNYKEQMEQYNKDNSRSGRVGHDEGLAETVGRTAGQQPAQAQQHNRDKR